MSNNAQQYNQLLPQDVDVEKAILGTILGGNKEATHEVLGILTKDDFYLDSHKIVYEAIVKLADAGQGIDMRSVTNHLKSKSLLNGIGGALFIAELSNQAAIYSGIAQNALIIKEKAILRGIIDMCSNGLKGSYAHNDVFDVVASLEKGLTKLSTGLVKKQARHLSSVIDEVIEDQHKPKKIGLHGQTSSIHVLDELTGGWQDTDLIILAARPGLGKTGMATVFATATAELGNAVALFTIEMNEKQNAIRILSQKTGIALTKIRMNKLSENEKNELEMKSLPISQLPIYVDDSTDLSIRDLRSKCIKLKREKQIKLIIIDYLQLMTDGGASKGNREQEVSNISRGLKQLAKELEIPVIALSQLSRSVEKRDKKHPRPILSDLRDSGAIEQDADMVMFLFREDYYDKNACDESGQSTRGVAEIIVAKHRNGDTDTVKCKFTNYTTNFSNLHEPIEEITAAPF